MKRTTMFIDEVLLRRLQRLAQRQGVSYATLVREALVQYLADPRVAGELPSIAGKFSSGETDTSERVDELLWRDPHQ
ncbi:MAG: CopG family transcriptional regulator [bacterium]